MERVTVVRGGTTVLQDVTLQAAEGELLVVLGSSGSGKSTLLRALVQTPDVFLLDEPLGDLDAVTGRALFHPEHVGSEERTSSGGDGAVHGEPG